EKVVASTAELRLEVFPGVDEVRPRLTAADVVLVLAHLDHKAGLEDVACLLHMIAEARRSTAILVLAEEHRPEQALALLRQGAADYLSRPLDLSRLAYLLDVLRVRARFVAARLPAPAPPPEAPLALGSKDPFFYEPFSQMGQLMAQVQRIAPQDTTVLLTGETG